VTVFEAINFARRNAVMNLRPIVARWRAMGIPEAAIHARSSALIEAGVTEARQKAKAQAVAGADRAMTRNVAAATMAALFERIN